MPKISVIVPVYNVERYINRCVDSILAQTFTDFELILVDDGSPDGCPAICDEYAKRDRRVKVIHKENAGVSAARNTGLDKARGKYILFVDSDDYITPGLLKNAYGAAIEEKADCVYFNCRFDTKECPKMGKLKDTKYEVGIYTLDSKEDIFNYLIHNILDIRAKKTGWSVWSRLFKRKIIKKNKLSFCDTCHGFAEDMAFVLEYTMFAKKIVGIRNPYYVYRQRPGSIMNKSHGISRLDDMTEVALHVKDVFNTVFTEPEEAKLFGVLHYLMMFVQYDEFIDRPTFKELGEHTKRIKKFVEYSENTRLIFECKDFLVKEYGENFTKRIFFLSEYCLDGDFKKLVKKRYELYLETLGGTAD